MTALLLRVAQTRWPVRSLGPGNRVAVWTQGCNIGCAGCMSLNSWDKSAGISIDALDLGAGLGAHCHAHNASLTVSGGEPLEQADALSAALHAFRSRAPEANVLLYTGYGQQQAEDLISAHDVPVDAAIVGPFEERLNQSDHWRGSANQIMVFVRPRYRALFENWASEPAPSPVEVSQESGAVTVVGIPGKGGLARLERRLSEEQITLTNREWAVADG